MRADRHIDRFIFVHHLHLVADRHPRGAAHDNPMLGSVMVQLQRQSPALLHHDALDLIAFAEIERLIGAPGPVHFQMVLRQRRRDLPSRSTTRRSPSPLSRLATSTASSVVTTTTLSRPSSATSCLSLAT